MRAGRVDDRGSISIWLVTATFAMTLLVGVAVDLTGQVHAQQHAQQVAAQAARTAGQQLQAPPAVRGQYAQVDLSPAVAAAETFLAASDVTGSAHPRGGTTVVVDTTDTYQTVFLSIIGLDGLTVHGHSESRVVRVAGGVEQ